MSVGVRTRIKVWVEGVEEFEGELVKFYAPLTVTDVVKRLPIEGMAGLWDFGVYISTDISRGAERVVEIVEEGDIVYWPPSRAIGLIFKRARPYAQTVKVGKIYGNIGKLSTTRAGARVRMLKL